MARYVPKAAGKVLNYQPNETVQEIVSYASKAMRGKILLDREIRGFEKADINGPKEAYENGPKGGSEPAHRTLIQTRENPEGYTNETPSKLNRVNNIKKDYISIVDIDFNPGEHKQTRHYSYLQLPFIPDYLDYNPESNFAAIASFGRNNPFYQYLGSEDTLNFEVDWFSSQMNRQDVIFNCRWLEALTKSNGYSESPHRVKIVWGGEGTNIQNIGQTEFNDMNQLFQDSIWVLVSAKYRLTDFVRGYRLNNNIISTNLLPQQARQNLVFKKLTDYNLTAGDIIGQVGIPR